MGYGATVLDAVRLDYDKSNLDKWAQKVSTWPDPDPPTNLTVALIPGGVRITWIDSATDNTDTEIYISIADGGFNLIDTVDEGIQTFDYLHDPGIELSIKIRAKI